MDLIELFAGVGGFRLGFETIPNNKVVWSNQWEPSTKKQHASEVYEARFGKEGHTNEDINKIKSSDIPNHQLLCGGFPCFVKGTKVLTKQGYKNIEDINYGDEVLTHTNTYQKVLTPMKQSVNHLCKLKIYGTEEITTTPNHPFYVIERTFKSKQWKEEGKLKKKKVYQYSEPKWVDTNDLTTTKDKKTSFVGININCEEKNIDFDINNIEYLRRKEYKSTNVKYTRLPFEKNEFYWFLGRYLADGWYQNQKRSGRKYSKVNKVILCCGHHEVVFVEKYLNKLGLHFTKSIENTTTKYIFSNLLLMEFVKKFGKGAKNKEIFKEIQDLPIKCLKYFIEGYTSGDGYYDKKTKIFNITTISQNLAYSFQNLIHKVYKIPCRVQKSKLPKKCFIEGREVNQNDIYKLSFRKKDVKYPHTFVKYNKLWVPVKRKKEIKYKETMVYNIEVENDNSYTIQNLVCHNCQTFSIMRPKNKSEGLSGVKGDKGILFWEIYRIAKEKNTPYLFLENVDRLLISPSKQKGRDMAVIIKSLNDLDYIVEWRVINAAEYGFPQKRKRVFIFAYKKDTIVSKKVLDNSNTIEKVKEVINKKSILSKSFPIEYIEEKDIKSYPLEEDFYNVSEDFNKNNKEKHPFLNCGIAIEGTIYTVKSQPKYEGKYTLLKDIILKDNKIEEEFFADDEITYEKWRKAKDKIHKERINKITGECYIFKGGAVPFPDKLNSPARTIITSEGGKSASRTTHIINPEGRLRRLHPIELERIQGFPDNHTKLEGVSNAKRGFLLGNALVVGVVERFAKELDNCIKEEEL